MHLVPTALSGFLSNRFEAATQHRTQKTAEGRRSRLVFYGPAEKHAGTSALAEDVHQSGEQRDLTAKKDTKHDLFT